MTCYGEGLFTVVLALLLDGARVGAMEYWAIFAVLLDLDRPRHRNASLSDVPADFPDTDPILGTLFRSS